MDHIIKVLRFFLRVYLKAWFTAPLATRAPAHDLALLKELESYKAVDADVSDATLQKFRNHLWYLNEKNICMALFDHTLPLDERRALATAILTSKAKSTKSKRPRINIHVNIQNLQLTNFVTKGSVKFFDIIGESPSFLQLDPSEWLQNDAYKSALSVVKNLKVVNDSAERAVHLMSHFHNSLTKDPEQQQYLLRGVHEHRKMYPSNKKSKLC